MNDETTWVRAPLEFALEPAEDRSHHLQRLECSHGFLSRNCERCGDAKEADSLRKEVAELRADRDFERDRANEWLARFHDTTKERDALKARLERALGVLTEARNFLERNSRRDCGPGKNAPGHGHSRPGVWDWDNGILAGKPCKWCVTDWPEINAILSETSEKAFEPVTDCLCPPCTTSVTPIPSENGSGE